LSIELGNWKKEVRWWNVLLTALFIVWVIPVFACAHVEKQNLTSADRFGFWEGVSKYQDLSVFRQEELFCMEAMKRYSIQVANKSNRRIGVVIR
jgi:hypothetical protein